MSLIIFFVSFQIKKKIISSFFFFFDILKYMLLWSDKKKLNRKIITINNKLKPTGRGRSAIEPEIFCFAINASLVGWMLVRYLLAFFFFIPLIWRHLIVYLFSLTALCLCLFSTKKKQHRSKIYKLITVNSRKNLIFNLHEDIYGFLLFFFFKAFWSANLKCFAGLVFYECLFQRNMCVRDERSLIIDRRCGVCM